MNQYKKAGVDIEVQSTLLKKVKKTVSKTHSENVLGAIGNFGACFRFPTEKFAKPVLVTSADGVGTKILVSQMAHREEGVGYDLVNHCVNDVLVQGAVDPLFFLDYYACDKLDPEVFQAVIRGITHACEENGLALIGGETAEMPGFYPPGVFDLAGFIVSVVEKDRMLTGRDLSPGDIIIGLPSTGLHTNGYSLARRICFEQEQLSVDSPLPGTNTTLGEALLQPHLSYLKVVKPLLQDGKIKALAHITGGGFLDNIPRVLPPEVNAFIRLGSWDIPPIFRFLQDKGKITDEEMLKVFNLGIGMCLFVSPIVSSEVTKYLKSQNQRFFVIGNLQPGTARVVFDLS
jgi:phosphoribosylformylglycinamidine cyclo-ligase